ncbi:hypothetical protein [Streptomyces sp. NPDC088258]|uniref:hypothetical protein n=1 Tax=Streptomyces sp. NPDC088258 TaxID=3365849 RepID=UPI00381F90AF
MTEYDSPVRALTARAEAAVISRLAAERAQEALTHRTFCRCTACEIRRADRRRNERTAITNHRGNR